MKNTNYMFVIFISTRVISGSIIKMLLWKRMHFQILGISQFTT